jgi:uncharacterized protein YqhQ
MASERTETGADDLRIGGMALGNGLLLQTAKHWAAAIRESDGSIEVASGGKRGLGSAADNLPLLRGVLRLADAMTVLPRVKAQLGNAQLPIEGPRMAGAIAASALGTLALRRRKGGSVLAQEVGAALLALAPAVIALRDSPLARYHGAEHKSIGEFERAGRGEPVTGATKEHERCGSNLIGPLLATSVVGNALLRSVMRKPTPGATLAANLVSLGSAMEIFRWMTRHPESSVARALSRPGYLLQHYLSTEEPTADQMEVAHRALAELLRLEGVTMTFAEAGA